MGALKTFDLHTLNVGLTPQKGMPNGKFQIMRGEGGVNGAHGQLKQTTSTWHRSQCPDLVAKPKGESQKLGGFSCLKTCKLKR